MERRKKLRMGETLVSQGLITLDQLRIGLKEQKATGPCRSAASWSLWVSSPRRCCARPVANALGSQGIDLTQVVADPEALQLVPEDFARRHHLLPIAHDAARNVLTLATTDMFNVVALDQLKAALGGQLEIDTCWRARRNCSNASTSSTASISRSTASCARSRLAKSTTPVSTPTPRTTPSRWCGWSARC